jgi:hypothetical protein
MSTSYGHFQTLRQLSGKFMSLFRDEAPFLLWDLSTLLSHRSIQQQRAYPIPTCCAKNSQTAYLLS